MDYKLFEEIRLSQVAKVPYRYSREVRWLPQIGDVVPNFNVDSTKGPISFHKFAEGNWVFLFSHPAAFTPVCTTEIASFATFAKDFEARGVKLLGISKSTIADQIRWHADIETIYDMHVTFPMIADEAGMLINLFGMLHNKQSPEWSIRKSIIIGPDLKIRMIFEYPILIGRSSDEMLRVIDALQTADTYNVATSADWRKGDDCLLLPSFLGEAKFAYGSAWRKFRSYLSTVVDPWQFAPFDDDGDPPTDPSGEAPLAEGRKARAS